MIIAGIDMGICNTKAAIMKDEKIIGRSAVPTGGIDRPQQAQKAYDEALKNAGIAAGDVERVVSTGKGKFDVAFASEHYTETVAAARAAQYALPGATAVMSAGADETLSAALGTTRLIDEFVLNQKCSAGIGAFLEYLGARLELTLEQISNCDGPDAGEMNEGCVVFSELDALSLLNAGAAPEAVMSTANRAAATRAATVLADLTASPGGNVVLIGGLAKNAAFVKALEARLGRSFTIPEDAEYCGAIGAALCSVKGI
ncbi:MAG: acyl-CoA dehydratase activase [Oscillospiraceae bacterium]|nr:acyl-CoA dehydratase activase [Oscillospiraceae bacterium]